MTEEKPKVQIHICFPKCDHQWDGPIELEDKGQSVTCSKCGMSMADYCMAVLP
jgi:hypothetical protein